MVYCHDIFGICNRSPIARVQLETFSSGVDNLGIAHRNHDHLCNVGRLDVMQILSDEVDYPYYI